MLSPVTPLHCGVSICIRFKSHEIMCHARALTIRPLLRRISIIGHFSPKFAESANIPLTTLSQSYSYSEISVFTVAITFCAHVSSTPDASMFPDAVFTQSAVVRNHGLLAVQFLQLKYWRQSLSKNNGTSTMWWKISQAWAATTWGIHSWCESIHYASSYKNNIFNIFQLRPLWLTLHFFIFQACESIFKTE